MRRHLERLPSRRPFLRRAALLAVSLLGLLAGRAARADAPTCGPDSEENIVQGRIDTELGRTNLDQGESTLEYAAGYGLARADITWHAFGRSWTLQVLLESEEDTRGPVPVEGDGQLDAMLCNTADGGGEASCELVLGSIDVSDVDDCAGDYCDTAFTFHMEGETSNYHTLSLDVSRQFVDVPAGCVHDFSCDCGGLMPMQ